MLREKLERYQRQHAHNLAVEGTVDILFKWQCSVESPQPLRLVPEQEYSFVDIAVCWPVILGILRLTLD